MSPLLLNVTLWIIFTLIILFSLLAGLVGFLKGIYKTTLKTVVKAILIIIFLFTTPSIANSVGNINFSSFNVSFQIRNTTINLTTIQQTLADILSATGFITPLNGLSLYETTISVSISLLSYAVFMIICILIQIFAPLITLIIYNGIFKWFLPVENKEDIKRRKEDSNLYELTSGISKESDEQVVVEGKKKWKLYKIPALFLSIGQEFVFLCVLISPLTSLSRVVVKNQENISTILELANIDDSKMKEYTTVINNSPLYNMLGVFNFDSTILNTASSVNINGQNVSFEKLINSSFDIIKPLISDNCLSYDSALGQVSVNFSYLLSKEMISTITEKILLNNILIALIPPLVDIGINSISNPNFTIPKIDFTNVNWSNDLSAINSIYSQIYDLGLVSQFISNDSKSLTSSNFIMKCSTFTDDDIKKYANVFKSATSLDIVKTNASKVMAGVGSLLNSQGLNILPSEEKEYESVNWEDDMSIFGETLFKGLRALQLDLTFNMNANQVQDKILETLKDKERRNVFKIAVIGDNENKGLLDTSFFKIMNLAKIMSSSLESIPQLRNYIQSIDFAEIFNDMSIEQIKYEFEAMFEVIEKIFDNDDIIDLTFLQNIDLKDPKTDEILADILLSSQKSKIFNFVFPSIMKNLLHNTNFTFSTYFYGITPYDLNYDSTNFTSTIQKTISYLPEIYQMLDNINALSTKQDKLNAIDTSLLRKWMNLMVNSDAFNAPGNSGIYNVESKNIVIFKFINNFFKSDALSILNFKDIRLEDIDNINWGEGTIGDKGEIDLICSAIEEMKINSSFLTSNNDNKFEDINDYDSLDNLFHNGLNSKVLSNTILYQINSSLESYFNQINVPLSINKLRTSLWLKKDDNNLDDINRLILSLKLLNGSDLFNINLLNLESDKTNALFTLFSECNFISVGGIDIFSDPFGYFIYNLIYSDSITDLDYKINLSSFNMEYLNYNWSKDISRNSYYLTINEKDVYFPITISGAIKDLTDLIEVVKTIGFENLKSFKLPSDNSYMDKIPSLKDNSYYKSLFIKDIYSQVLNTSINKILLPNSYDLFTSYIDFSYIKSNDVSLKDEINTFITFNNLIENNKFELMLDNIFSLKNNGLFDEFSIFINQLADSNLLKYKKENKDMSPISYLLFNIIENNNLTSLFSSNNDSLLIKGILNSVKDYKEELSVKFINIVDSIQGIDLSNISFIDDDITSVKAKGILTSLNESSIFHIVSINLFKKDLNNKDFDKLLFDNQNNIYHSFNFDIHLDGNKIEDISYWQNDYDLFIDMIYLDTTFNSFIKTNNSLLNGKISSSLSSSFIYYISEMNLFKKNRSYFLYNLLVQTIGSSSTVNMLFKDSLLTPYLEHSKVYRLEELFFNNPDINVSDKNLRKENKLYELKLFDNLLIILTSKLNSIDSIASISDIKLDITYEELISKTALTLKNNVVYRSKLTSEIIASYFTILENKNILDSNIDFFENDYFLVNQIEARCIDGFISLFETITASSNFVNMNSIGDSFIKFGLTYDTYFDDESFIYNFNDENQVVSYLLNNFYFTNANSKKYNSFISQTNNFKTTLFNMIVSDLNNNIRKLNTIVTYDYLVNNNYSYTDFYYLYMKVNFK